MAILHFGTSHDVLCFLKMKNPLLLAVFVAIAACVPEPISTSDSEGDDPKGNKNAISGDAGVLTPVVPSYRAQTGNLLTIEGLGELQIGFPVPADSKWIGRGAQASDTCLTISSPNYPGVYALIERGKVRRITAGQNSAVRLSENIGVGSTEMDVQKSFPGFRVEPHKYVASPAKYLTAPNAASDDSALRFEINDDGKVSLIHVGNMPVLGNVEGCA